MKTENLSYIHADTELEAFVAYPDDLTGSAPAVLIGHDWTGRNDFACDKAKKMAELGYIGFALDIFGKGVLGASVEEKSALIAPFMNNRQFLRARIHAALVSLESIPQVDSDRIAAMGFCFGGLCVLDLARSGADICGVISFHGLLHPPESLPNNAIKAKVLALHGHEDPMVPPDVVAAFTEEMTQAGVDWQIHVYGNTQHAFTNPEAHDTKLGTIYNPIAEQRSWQTLQNMLNELFQG